MPPPDISAWQPWMRDDVAVALREEGCPRDVAAALAGQARLEADDAGWLLVLHGHGCGGEAPVLRAVWQEAARQVAENVAADNAEVADRAARGEEGRPPLWPVERYPRS